MHFPGRTHPIHLLNRESRVFRTIYILGMRYINDKYLPRQAYVYNGPVRLSDVLKVPSS